MDWKRFFSLRWMPDPLPHVPGAERVWRDENGMACVRMAPKPRMEWRKGLTQYGGEAIVSLETGVIRGRAYKLTDSWWAKVDHQVLDEFASMEDAKRAVERKLGVTT